MSVVGEQQLGLEFIAAARGRIGRPFRHHFKPNRCGDGLETLLDCMRYGVNDEGYDCSGLVVASMCDVLGIGPDAWPLPYRHAAQLKELAVFRRPRSGDVLLSYNPGSGTPHVAVFVRARTVIQASGYSGLVEERQFSHPLRPAGVIACRALANIVGSANTAVA